MYSSQDQCPPGAEDSSREARIFMAKLAEQAERYKEASLKAYVGRVDMAATG